MADPAIEAAQRAFQEHGYFDPEDAAREALKPIRELHKPITMCGVTCCQRCRTPDGASAGWPCETARLVYSSEELDRG